jgi:hypothetical protein
MRKPCYWHNYCRSLWSFSALFRVNVAHETEFVRVYWRFGNLATGIITVGPLGPTYARIGKITVQ